ncbi:MerR family transcriptional regulator [Paraglaciecola arctica]|uniref:Transcriptional regulator, MerR family n=1 Tax=Paraglaciecola arctica BSs20135 TaxID=493475 RepID=K6YS44_9ALTE|nr:MerR family transcriptional regulator [Paraglaciecola arctica]GAC19503.1 transcriptional regulator, MerR family [Paraglaciecola arctica BSs20135]
MANNSPKIENIAGLENFFHNVIPDFNGFIHANDELLTFPLSISQLTNAAQTTVHTGRNYVIENLLHSKKKTKLGYGLYDLSALKRLRFIWAVRAAGLLIIDNKPLLIAINTNEQGASQDLLSTLNTKVQQRKNYLDIVAKQINASGELA